jgi:UDP-glucose 4-epimerase
MRKRIVVFGGNGFIGSYLIDELEKRGHDIVSADLYKSRYVDEKYFTKCDIMDRQNVMDICEDADIVYNFAGMANLDSAVENPIRTIELNIIGNMNILEACRYNHVERFIYASSAYAMNDKGSFYGISKLSSEKIIEEYYKKYGLRFTIVRYGSVYGERNYSNNYIYNLIKSAIETGKIIHGGDGEEKREYIHAADVAKLSADIFECDDFINRHLILTGVEVMKRKELFEMINEILGGDIEIEYKRDGYKNHYKTTPYSFRPILSKKLLPNPYIDMGQGMVECIKNIYNEKDK